MFPTVQKLLRYLQWNLRFEELYHEDTKIEKITIIIVGTRKS